MRTALLVAAVMVFTSWSATGQEPNAKVTETFARASKAQPAVVGCYGGPALVDRSGTNGGFSVMVQGLVGLVSRAAAETKKMYKPFTAVDGHEAMAADIIIATAPPTNPEFGPTNLAFVK